VRIAVLGTCASGKSTIVAELRRRGYEAYVVSQEHSIVRNLWQHEEPDVVVLLEAKYRSICERRGDAWPRWLFDLQRQRLGDARLNAHLIVDTSVESVQASIGRITSYLEGYTEPEIRAN
jgi:dephospho-CoA kinase